MNEAFRTPGPPSVTGPRAVVRKPGWGSTPGALDSSERVPRPGPPRPRHPRRPPLSLIRRLLAGAALVTLAASPPALAVPAAPKAPATPPAGGSPTPGTRNAVVIEGDDHLFMVGSPRGWVLDDTSGMGSRIRCVFYPVGQSWATAPTVMYVNPLHGFGLKTRTLSAMIAESEKAFYKRAPKGRITDAGTLTTGAGKPARVHYFAPDGRQPVEAVTYVPEKELIMLVVLSSRTAAGFQQALPAYRELVGTYAWVGSNREFGR